MIVKVKISRKKLPTEIGDTQNLWQPKFMAEN
jgi:hypothetical protein